MTIINNSYKFIFVHIPKAAGTTITNQLSAYTNYCDLEIGGTCFGEKIQPAYKKRFNISKHSTATELQAITGEIEWSKNFTFAFVRNPYDRALSTYNFLLEWRGTPIRLKNELLKFKNFSEFIESDFLLTRPGPDNIFKPQTHWATKKGKNLLNYIGKLETINEDITHILHQILGRPLPQKIAVKKLNSSSSSSNKISEKAIKKINELYETDFNTFEYEMR